MTKHNDETGTQNRWNTVLEIIKVGFPLLTLVLGYFIYTAQSKFQSHIDNRVNGLQIELQTQLQHQANLQEEFYRRRIVAYEKICDEMASVAAALNNAGATTEDFSRATDSIAKFERVNKGNVFYWSTPLQAGLEDFWGLGLKKLQTGNWSDDDIDAMMMVVQRQMKSDLDVSDKPASTEGK